MTITFSEEVKRDFPDLHVLTSLIENVTVKRFDSDLEAFKKEIIEEIKNAYDIQTLKDLSLIHI